jgi:hypothetical protein
MSEPRKKSFAARTITVIGAGFVVAFVIVVVIPYFVRARETRSTNACINNLRQIKGAKEQWALENNKHSNGIPTGAELSVYLGNNKMPECPLGGTYIIGRVNEDPQCSLAASTWPNDHVLNPTNNSWSRDFKEAYSILLGRRHVLR